MWEQSYACSNQTDRTRLDCVFTIKAYITNLGSTPSVSEWKYSQIGKASILRIDKYPERGKCFSNLNAIYILRGYGGIGKHTGFRDQRGVILLEVQIFLSANLRKGGRVVKGPGL